MRSLVVVFALLSLACATTDSERLAKLESISSSKPSNVLTLSIDSFTRYVEAPSRSYSMVVFFGADPAICEPCAPMQASFTSVAREYRSASRSARARHPVYFAVLKLSHADQEFLSRYQINRVPILYHFGARASVPRPLEDADSYNVQQLGISTNEVKRFLNERLGSRLRVVRGNYQVPFQATVRSLRPALAGFLVVFSATVVRSGAYRSAMFWFSCVVAVYIYSVGGGHYSWIHDTPIYTVNRDGVPEFIAGGARSQYVAEGFFVSVTCVSISAFIIAMQEMPRWVPNKSAQSATGLMLAGFTFAAISALLSLYHLKMPGYLQYNEI